jgi:hypothetical protein
MSCNDSKTVGPIPVWSNKTTNTWLFHPLAPPQSSAGVNFVRPTLEVGQSSGAIKVRPAVRSSNDLQSWDAPVAIAEASMTQTNDGVKYGAFADIQAGAKNFLQLGAEVTNSAGADTELAMVSLRIDSKA